MQEFMRVDHPALWPQHCIACKTQLGAMTDTRTELPDGTRVYVCTSCTRLLMRAEGLLKGPQHDRLLDSARLLAEADKQIAVLEGERHDLRAQVEEAARLAGRLQNELDEARDREVTRQHQLEELQRQAGALV